MNLVNETFPAFFAFSSSLAQMWHKWSCSPATNLNNMHEVCKREIWCLSRAKFHDSTTASQWDKQNLRFRWRLSVEVGRRTELGPAWPITSTSLYHVGPNVVQIQSREVSHITHIDAEQQVAYITLALYLSFRVSTDRLVLRSTYSRNLKTSSSSSSARPDRQRHWYYPVLRQRCAEKIEACYQHTMQNRGLLTTNVHQRRPNNNSFRRNAIAFRTIGVG